VPDAEFATYDGATGEALARALSLPRVVVFHEVASTMDVANELAGQGAAAGTLVIADAQGAGRGRAGRRWESRAGDGIWMTLIERVNDPSALDVLSLRIGIRAARALDRFSASPVRLKWPNDMFLGAGKLGGILVESRWRGTLPEWTAIGIGINVRAVNFPGGAALGASVSRVEVLGELVPALRAAATARGHLTPGELHEFATRDMGVGRRCREPIPGLVAGIRNDGAVLVESTTGTKALRDGSLVFEEPS
jgi:BirA family biotin operon repressor/biotin-[acetyl-CoA-carboxylase] ligase